MNNLFVSVMEAEGNELQPFSSDDNIDNSTTNSGDAAEQQSPPQQDQNIGDTPPELNESNDNNIQSFDDSNSGDNTTDTGNADDGNNNTDDYNPDDDTKSNQKISEKANDILNQQLYEQMVSYNNDLDDLLDSLQTIVPVLPFEVVREIDNNTVKLQDTLTTSKNYVINKFINSPYGANLVFFEKVKSLSEILKTQINKCLKQVK